MGFNLSGLAINKNYENDFDHLQKELGWNLEKQSEIDFVAVVGKCIISLVYHSTTRKLLVIPSAAVGCFHQRPMPELLSNG